MCLPKALYDGEEGVDGSRRRDASAKGSWYHRIELGRRSQARNRHPEVP